MAIAALETCSAVLWLLDSQKLARGVLLVWAEDLFHQQVPAGFVCITHVVSGIRASTSRGHAARMKCVLPTSLYVKGTTQCVQVQAQARV